MTSLEPARSSIINIKVGNREYPAVQNIRCNVCMHPARFQIESRILQNYSYPSVTRWVSEQRQTKADGSVEEWPDITVPQIQGHIKKGHCPLDTEMVHALAEQRSKQLGFDLEKDTGQFVDHVVANKIILQRVVEGLVTGRLEPDTKDGMAAIKMAAELEANAKARVNEEQLQELFMVYFKTVQANVSAEQWSIIMNEIASNPLVQAYQERQALEGQKQ